MAWTEARSRERIENLLRSVPNTQVNVSVFDNAFLSKRREEIQNRRAAGGRSEELIFNVGPRSAVVVDGAHVYVQLLDFADAMLDQQRETPESHRRVLTMLHLHYAACDSIAERFEAQRVDYHGPRMHAVIVSPTGPENEAVRAQRALAFADAVKRTIEEVGRSVSGGRYSTRVRIGIDSGTAVAVNSGRANEPEPLFLGNPANYAAKLAEGDEAGVFPSDRIRFALGLARVVGGITSEKRMAIDATSALAAAGARQFVVNSADIAAASTQAAARLSSVSFDFHAHTPPLRTIDFLDLMPSNSIRMDLISIFADLDRFTAYVSDCIRSRRIREMVTTLHVIRGELAATLKEDFGGRKVRFIGDCLHGLVAEGTSHEVDARATVTAAVRAAGGMRSSFELCREYLEDAGRLGLAIGIEFGTTPVTRIGIRGDRSIRCSVSKAVTASEDLQAGCGGEQTAIGPRAYQNASASIRRVFGSEMVADGLDYASVSELLATPATITKGGVSAVAAPHFDADCLAD